SGRDCDLLMLAATFGGSPEDPDAEGLMLLRRLREQPAAPAVIALAEAGHQLTAGGAPRRGAGDYPPQRVLTPRRPSTPVRVALRRVERRVARRLASLANLARDGARRASEEAVTEGDTVEPPAGDKAVPAAAGASKAATADVAAGAEGVLTPSSVAELL